MLNEKFGTKFLSHGRFCYHWPDKDIRSELEFVGSGPWYLHDSSANRPLS